MSGVFFDVSIRFRCEQCALNVLLDVAGRYRGVVSVAVSRSDAPDDGSVVALLAPNVRLLPPIAPCKEHGDVLREGQTRPSKENDR